MGTRNQNYDYEMNGVKLDGVQYVKDLGVSIASNLKFFPSNAKMTWVKPIESWGL